MDCLFIFEFKNSTLTPFLSLKLILNQFLGSKIYLELIFEIKILDPS